MKKQSLIFLLTNLALLTFTACGKASDPAPAAAPEVETLPVESDKDMQTTQETSEPVSNDINTVTIEKQDISYWTPTGNTKLADIHLQTVLLNDSGNEAILKINEDFLDTYENALTLIDGSSSSGEGDFLYKLPASAYEQYASMDASGNGETFSPYYYYQDYSVQRIDNMVFSNFAESDSYCGGAHGSQYQYGINYDMNTGEILTIADISDNTDTFISYCTEQLLTLAADKEANGTVFFEGYQDNIADIISDDTFYFSKEGLCFISQEYMLQPYSSGTIVFCIPYEDLKDYIKADYYPTDASWDFKITDTEKEPITYTYQADFHDDVVVPMLDSFLSWTGLLYFYGDDVQFDSLTPEAALSMAGFAIISNYAYDEAWYDDNVGGYAIPDSLIDAYTENYFGKTYDISSFQASELSPMVEPASQGGLLVHVGDWGLVAPKYEVTATTKNDDASYTVSVNYFAYDYELSQESDTLATAEYIFTPYSNSTFGYVITDMKFTQIGTLQ